MVYELTVIDKSFKSTASSLQSNPYTPLSKDEDYLSEVFNRLFFAAGSTCFGKYCRLLLALNPFRFEYRYLLELGGQPLSLLHQQK